LPVRLPVLLPLLLLIASSLPPALHAQDPTSGIRLTVAEDTVYVGDSVTLEIESVGLLEPLDTSPLFIGADLLRETAGTRITVIGGQVMDVRTRRMEFLPRAEGAVAFGPLRGETANGPVQSNRVVVTVAAPVEDAWQPGADDARAEISLSSSTPWVREQVTLDIVLRHRFAIADETIELPDLAGFDVLPVFERRRTLEPADETRETSKPMRRIAWRYLLWPRRSGPLEIGALRWQGTMVRSRTARGPIDTGTAPQSLDVRAAPADADAWWLPASALSLSDGWSSDLADLTAGSEIERTLTVEARGVLASQLPVVEPLASRSFTSVALGGSRDQQLIGDVVTATASYRFRLTARSPVPVFLDTVRVGWWDTVNEAAAEAIVPARRVDIGLPDRADLLADVALEQGAGSRTWLALQSVDLPAAAGIALAAALTLGMAISALMPLWRRRRRQAGRAEPAVLPPP